MLIAGITSTRPGGIALVRDGRLDFCTGFESTGSESTGLEPAAGPVAEEPILRSLASRNYALDDVDEWVLDDAPDASTDPLRPGPGGNLELGGKTKTYSAYTRAATRLAAAYCTSPFARDRQPCLVLVWDAGAPPRLYTVDAEGRARPAAGPASVGATTPPERIVDGIRTHTAGPIDLCLTGGRALDPERNSAIRDHPDVRALWIPPFPDDSGAAIGAAAARLARGGALRPIEWTVRLGPEPVRPIHLPAGWSCAPCRPEELARLLHRSGRPVMVISRRAALGPRALGARTVLAPATRPGASGRVAGPVAAVCHTEQAATVFHPGTPDPFQHYTHRVRAEWADRVPAVVGPDGSVQLYTVDRDGDPVLATLIREYHKWSGVPVLCATEARSPVGRVFAGPVDAMTHGDVDPVWCNGVLYSRDRAGHGGAGRGGAGEESSR
jgi:hypothetical protein